MIDSFHLPLINRYNYSLYIILLNLAPSAGLFPLLVYSLNTQYLEFYLLITLLRFISLKIFLLVIFKPHFYCLKLIGLLSFNALLFGDKIGNLISNFNFCLLPRTISYFIKCYIQMYYCYKMNSDLRGICFFRVQDGETTHVCRNF